mmetsp:Transcript_911/g.1385  ORF Transcript_911/g.1385 Transcript_911/m.1385 type:complete len:659 (+) Transcript_911:65-2041(+)
MEPNNENDKIENKVAEQDEEIGGQETQPRAEEEDASTQNHEGENSQSLDRSDCRVMVYNILKFINNKDIPKLFKKWLATHEDPDSIEITHWRKAPHATWVILTCKTEDMAQKLINHINDNKITNNKGRELLATKSEGSQNKRSHGQDESNAQQDSKKRAIPLQDDQVRDKLTPLWHLSYEDQLKEKLKNMIRKCTLKLCQEIKKKFQNISREAKRNPNREKVELYSWLKSRRAIEVKDVIASPQQHAYRNKCEFTFGYREKDGKQIPSVGFLASGWSGGVSLPHICQNISWEFCALAEIFEEFLKDSPIPPYDSRQHEGLWRILTIRSSRRTKECMIIIQHAPPSGGAAGTQKEDYSNVFDSEKKRLLNMLVNKDLPNVKRPLEVQDSHSTLRVSSIFFQEYDGLSNPPPEHDVQHAFGKKYLTEKLGDCEFQISPGAFFQVNTKCAELLYQVAVDKVKEVNPSDTLLLDVCCGTGSIGLICKKQGAVSKVIGVDISEPAIVDANANAKLNNLDQGVRFIASKAELVMGRETNKLTKETPVVAIVDPARNGLHQDVLRSIRMTEVIKRIVYVSCNPTGSLIQDAATLCAPPTKKFRGCAFRPTFAQPVDMFPMSDHCEMVMVFDRITEEDEFGSKEENYNDDGKSSTEEKHDANTTGN